MSSQVWFILMPCSLYTVSGTSRVFPQANDSPGGTGGDRQYSYSVVLLMRNCTVKLDNNLSPGICGHLVLLPNEPKTGTRLDAALSVLSALSAMETGRLCPAQGDL